MDHALLVLGLLKLQAMHGYQLGDLIDRRLSYLVDLKKPTLYHLLTRLEAAGDVVKHASRAGNRPERYTYELTAQGETHFAALLRENLSGAHTAYFVDDLGLIFLSELPAAEARGYLENKRRSLAERFAALSVALAQHRAGTPPYLTLKHHLAHLRAEREWLDEMLRELVARPVRTDILACLAETPAPPRSSGPEHPPRGARRGIGKKNSSWK